MDSEIIGVRVLHWTGIETDELKEHRFKAYIDVRDEGGIYRYASMATGRTIADAVRRCVLRWAFRWREPFDFDPGREPVAIDFLHKALGRPRVPLAMNPDDLEYCLRNRDRISSLQTKKGPTRG